jgi:tol-pal system protein YbgF
MRRSALGFGLVCLLAAQANWAGPLEDALAQLSTLAAASKSQNDRIARLEAQLQSQGLLGLLNQVETLKADLARLRGAQEEQAYRLEAADKRTRDLFLDLDERLKEVASRPIALPADAIRLQPSQSLVSSRLQAEMPISASDAETEARAYEVAHGLIKAGKYKDAIAAFRAFVSQYPNGTLAANAVYWIGISQVTGLSDFKAAAETYKSLLKDYPASPKVPDTLLSLARAQIHQNDRDAARSTLDQLLATHPASKAAENGKKLLATLN